MSPFRTRARSLRASAEVPRCDVVTVFRYPLLPLRVDRRYRVFSVWLRFRVTSPDHPCSLPEARKRLLSFGKPAECRARWFCCFFPRSNNGARVRFFHPQHILSVAAGSSENLRPTLVRHQRVANPFACLPRS